MTRSTRPALLGVLALSLAATTEAAPAARPAPAAGPATVSVAGLRVVGPGVGEDGTELRAFNESPGVVFVLVVKAPGKTGLVEIDEDESTIESVTDDKGTNLMEEARFGSFPHVSKDGTAGMFEVEVRVRPAAGATSLKLAGTLAYTAAAGTKPVKAPKVVLEKGKTFKLGTTTVTLGEVAPGEEGRTNLTLKLPRSVMQQIKTVRFTDDKGQAIESSAAGSGYMNDEAEMSFSVHTAAKTANLAFDMWDGLKVTKLPFAVETGLSLNK